MPYSEPKLTFNHDEKFDLQLSAGLIAERQLGEILEFGSFATKLEIKCESWQWEQTGNIAIEYQNGDRLSGIAVTEADWWVHILKRKDETLIVLLVPIPRLKDIARRAIREGRHRMGGDGGKYHMAILPLMDLFR